MIGQGGFPLALALAGYAVTRMVVSGPADRPFLASLTTVWGRLALWAVPALAVVVAVVTVAGVVLLPPADLRTQAWTALSTLSGLSGFDLLRQGPHAPRTSGELLLHGWFPGVAAQLALGWSLVLVLMRRTGLARRVVPVAVVGLAASLVLDLILRREGLQAAAFYLAPPRAWPFLAGALLALGGPWPERWNRKVPLWLEGPARLGRLALPFYLWSWPLLALPGLVLARPLQPAESIAAQLIALVLAWATHHWVESPLRRRFHGRPGRALALSAILLGAVSLAAAGLATLQGLPGRATAAVRAEEAAVLRRPPLTSVCNTEGTTLPAAGPCTVPTGARAEVVLWGNSHADQLSPAVMAWAERRGLGFRQATRSGCLPLLRARAGLVNDGCLAFNRAAVAEWSRESPDVIVLGAAWTVVLDRTPGEATANLEALIAELAHTVRTLRAAVGPETRIVLIGTTPDYALAPGGCHARRAFLGLDTQRCDRAVPDNAAGALSVDAQLASLAAAQPGVALYRPWTVLCDGGLCRTRGEDGPWYADRNHMTEAGGVAQTVALAAVLDAHVQSRP